MLHTFEVYNTIVLLNKILYKKFQLCKTVQHKINTKFDHLAMTSGMHVC